MKIAIPLAGGQLSQHFGHCEQFAIVEADENSRELLGSSLHDAPPHEPGVLPSWLASLGVTMVIAGGMGQRAQNIFAANGIGVLAGAPADSPDALVAAYLDGKLQPGINACDH